MTKNGTGMHTEFSEEPSNDLSTTVVYYNNLVNTNITTYEVQTMGNTGKKLPSNYKAVEAAALA